MKLVKYEGYNLTIEPEMLLLKPFKKIWNRDRSKNKDRALQELGYIYFMEDPRSDYQIYIDEKVRSKEIIQGEGILDWKPDSVIEEARKFYASFKSTSALLLEDTRVMIEGYRKKIKEITLNMEDMEVKDIKDIGVIIKQIPILIKDLDAAEKAISSEIMKEDKIKGSQEKAMFEDLINV